MTDLRLWYDTPAAAWTEALPVGNGRLGAMVFGGVARERLQLNEDTLWAGGPYSPVNPEARAHLDTVRELLFAGEYAKAEALANRHVMAIPLRQMPYQPAADLWIDTDVAGDPEPGSYRRELDLERATTRTRFTIDGTTFERESFATAADGVLVIRIVASRPGALSLRLTLTSPQSGSIMHADGGMLRFTGQNRAAEGIPGALAFATELRVRSDGRATGRDGGIDVADATEALILVDIGTSYRSSSDPDGDPVASITARLGAASARTYEDLLARHVADHARYFGRLSIDLGTTAAAALPTDRRIAANSTTGDPALAALFVQYGRYLMLACSRPGTQAANLQGLWNDLVSPPWGSKYTVNINTEMNYWLPDIANLGECFEPFIRLAEEAAESGRETARQMYGAPGWVLHHNTDLWRATAPIDGAEWGLWPTGGAWFCAQLWDHVSFGADDVLVERLYPVMLGAAEFFAHTLVPLPGTEMLVTAPSLSPENIHPKGASLCFGPAMDSQILRDLFTATIEAGERLDRDPELRERFAAIRARLPQDRIGSAGQLQEWLDDWDMDVPELHHRHASHLYALYPGHQISLEATPTLAAAARKSLDIRGDDATGWGIGWRINLWARLRDAERTHAIVQRLLSPGRTYPNMFDAHPPFQIDGNFGGAAGILEMLVQSSPGALHLLPALPSAWPSGALSGVRARGGVEVAMRWQGAVLTAAKVRALRPHRLTVHTGAKSLVVDVGSAWTEVDLGQVASS
jgi:alpha-L-fucosidase 2